MDSDAYYCGICHKCKKLYTLCICEPKEKKEIVTKKPTGKGE